MLALSPPTACVLRCYNDRKYVSLAYAVFLGFNLRGRLIKENEASLTVNVVISAS